MRVEIPEFTRCCFCAPLRYGILAYAYCNLIWSIVIVGCLAFIVHADLPLRTTTSLIIGDDEKFPLAVIVVLFFVLALDIIMASLLVIGGHMKNVLLMKIFYYYTLVSLLIPAISLLQFDGFKDVAETFTTLFAMCFHGYILLIVRSEIRKLEASGLVHYNSPQTEVKMDKGIENPYTVI